MIYLHEKVIYLLCSNITDVNVQNFHHKLQLFEKKIVEMKCVMTPSTLTQQCRHIVFVANSFVSNLSDGKILGYEDSDYKTPYTMMFFNSGGCKWCVQKPWPVFPSNLFDLT